MAPHEVVGSPILARAIDHFYLFFVDFKKRINQRFNFLIHTLSSSYTHTSVSPLFRFSLSTISWGIVVFNESDLVVLYPIFVNNFINNHSFCYNFVSIIFIYIIIYNLLNLQIYSN